MVCWFRMPLKRECRVNMPPRLQVNTGRGFISRGGIADGYRVHVLPRPSRIRITASSVPLTRGHIARSVAAGHHRKVSSPRNRSRPGALVVSQRSTSSRPWRHESSGGIPSPGRAEGLFRQAGLLPKLTAVGDDSHVFWTPLRHQCPLVWVCPRILSPPRTSAAVSPTRRVVGTSWAGLLQAGTR